MSTSLYISGHHPAGHANSLKSQGASGRSGGLQGFLDMLLGQAQDGSDAAAKISAQLKNNPSDKASLVALLQKLYPDAGAGDLQQAAGTLQAQAQAGSGISPALTSDLSSSSATDAQQSADVLAQLQDKLNALTSDGPVSDNALAQFRKDAVDFMKANGLDDAAINDNLVSLANQLNNSLTTAQAAQLAMPVPAQPAPQTAAATPADNGIAPVSVQDFASHQLAQAAKTGIAPSDNKGLPPRADAPPAPQPEDAPAAKPLPSSSHVSMVNSLAQDDSSANSGGGDFGSAGQQLFQGDTGQSAATATITPQGGISQPQSFVNYMTSSSGAAPVSQTVAVQIQQNANAGISTFTMQLNPAELGRLEVKLKFDRDGGIKAHLIADKPETLAMLKQDSGQINRILQQSGLTMDDTSLTFDLRQQGQQQGSDQSYNGAGQSSGGYDASSDDASNALQAKIAVEAMGYIRQNGVNIMV